MTINENAFEVLTVPLSGSLSSVDEAVDYFKDEMALDSTNGDYQALFDFMRFLGKFKMEIAKVNVHLNVLKQQNPGFFARIVALEGQMSASIGANNATRDKLSMLMDHVVDALFYCQVNSVPFVGITVANISSAYTSSHSLDTGLHAQKTSFRSKLRLCCASRQLEEEA